MAREPQPYMQNRELSWLTFNERVLEEARDPSNPLAERLKFVSIFTSNLDEFFMIRVGSLYDMAVMGDDQVDSRTGLLPSQQLEAIYRRAVLLMEQRDQVYAQLQTQLQAYGVCEVSPGQLAGKDKDFLKTYFKTQLLPILSPQIVDINHPFPHLRTRASMWWPASMGRTAVSSASSLCLPPPPTLSISPGRACAMCAPNSCFWIT